MSDSRPSRSAAQSPDQPASDGGSDHLFDVSAEGRCASRPASAPRDRGSPEGQADCHRQRDLSGEDRCASRQASASRDGTSGEGQAGPSTIVNKRKTPKQATSYMAMRDTCEPDPDDPLLGFAPVPHKRPRRNSITADRQRAFIAHLAATGIVKQAAAHIGASLEALYKLRARPGAEEFSAAWDAAVDRGVQRLEDGALARAIAGEERMVVSAGKVLGTEIRHNDALVMFFLRNRRGERYGGDTRVLRPGHPVYERIRAEVLADQRRVSLAEEDAILQGIERKIDIMARREREGLAMLDREELEEAVREEFGDGDA